MSVIRPRLPADPIAFVPPPDRRPVDGQGGGCPGAAREVVTAIIEAPERLLAEYRMERPESALYAIFQTARRLRDATDRVVVVADAGETAAAHAVLATCCHPFHDQLPRADRGGRPRIAFTGDTFDTDRDRGLLDLVAPPGRFPAADLLDRWALVVVAAPTAGPAVAASARLFFNTLLHAVHEDRAAVAARLAAVGSGAAALAHSVGAAEPFAVPGGLSGAWTVFSAVGLLPAAIAGIDVVRLLEGAVAMSMRFCESPPDDNPVWAFATSRPATRHGRPHLLRAGDDRLARVAAWFEHLQQRGPGDDGPASVTRLRVGQPRCDPLVVPPSATCLPAGDGLPIDECVGAVWCDLAGAAEPSPGATIDLPRVDEHAIGQLLQLLMLATRLADSGIVPPAGGAAGPV